MCDPQELLDPQRWGGAIACKASTDSVVFAVVLARGRNVERTEIQFVDAGRAGGEHSVCELERSRTINRVDRCISAATPRATATFDASIWRAGGDPGSPVLPSRLGMRAARVAAALRTLKHFIRLCLPLNHRL